MKSSIQDQSDRNRPIAIRLTPIERSSSAKTWAPGSLLRVIGLALVSGALMVGNPGTAIAQDESGFRLPPPPPGGPGGPGMRGPGGPGMRGPGGPGMRGPGPGPALIWVGTATEGEDELPARVFLLPPPPPRPDASDSDTTDASSDDTDSADSTDSTDSTDAADSSDSSVDDGTVSESMAFLGRGPGFGPHPPPMGPPHPGELRIGNVILFIKPTSAEIEDAATDSEDGLPRPPRLKSLQAELIRSPRLGPDASDSEDSSEPQSIGTLEFTITAGESEGSPATVSGTATITDPQRCSPA